MELINHAPKYCVVVVLKTLGVGVFYTLVKSVPHHTSSSHVNQGIEYMTNLLIAISSALLGLDALDGGTVLVAGHNTLLDVLRPLRNYLLLPGETLSRHIWCRRS